MRLTPEEEAAYSLGYGVARADLKPQVQAAYDRLLEERKAEAARAHSRASYPPATATWQGSPVRSQWQKNWSIVLFLAALLGVVAAFVVGGFGGTNPNDGPSIAASSLLLLALAALCVAIPGMVYRWYRGRRLAAMAARPPASPFAFCYRCRYPLAVHFGDDLKCPQGGTCYRCGQLLAAHAGYELTCPDAKAPHCYRCGQPFAAHVADGLPCPVPPVLVS